MITQSSSGKCIVIECDAIYSYQNHRSMRKIPPIALLCDSGSHRTTVRCSVMSEVQISVDMVLQHRAFCSMKAYHRGNRIASNFECSSDSHIEEQRPLGYLHRSHCKQGRDSRSRIPEKGFRILDPGVGKKKK